MNISMVGYGSIARLNLEALLEKGARPHSVVGRLAEPTADFAREFGFAQHTTDLGEALADPEVEAVVICTPNELHAEQVRQALEANKHVLCEIPLAMSLVEVDELASLAKARDRRLMVCHTQRFWPNRARAHEIIAAGQITPWHVVYRHLMLRRDTINWMGRERSWVDNLLWHHGCHSVDMALWLLGADEVETTSEAAHPRQAHGNPMDVGIVMRTPADQLATVALSYNSHYQIKDCQVIGAEETLYIDEARLRNSQGLLYEPPAGANIMDLARRLQAEEFIAAVREGREPATGVPSVRPAYVVLQSVQDKLNARLSADEY
ncbi:MAG: Gfo/Idh/MocA family protein [Chloroflexota bacterium]